MAADTEPVDHVIDHSMDDDEMALTSLEEHLEASAWALLY